MISTAPLRRLLCERDLTFQALSMASGIDERKDLCFNAIIDKKTGTD